MPLIIIALGASMLLGGIAALVMGLPYIVLERGFTQVIIGSVVATGGVMVMIAGVILRELRRNIRSSAPVSQNTSDNALSVGSSLAKGAAVAGAGGLAIALQGSESDKDADKERANADEEHQHMLPFDQEQTVEVVSTETINIDDDASPEVTTTPALEPSSEPVPYVEENYDDLRQSLIADHSSGTTSLEEEHAEHAQATREAETEVKEEEEKAEEEAETDSHDTTTADEAAITIETQDVATPLEKQDDEPVTSDEGIISVKQIGSSIYTMYADGRVRAQTPSGERFFASIAELKDHLALNA